MQNQTKLIVVSGCSGGGKSTLLDELSRHCFAVISEVGRQIVKEQQKIKNGITPWDNPQEFCRLLINRSLDEYKRALKLIETKNNVIFFDRSFLEGVSYFNSLNVNKYNSLVSEFRYYPRVFMTPPWQDIFCHDDERKHSFSHSVIEYERLLKFYEQSGYEIIKIPRTTVSDRFDFMIKKLNEIIL